MPSISVSLPSVQFTALQNKAVSPSKALQLGARLILEHGINGLEEIISKSEKIEKEIIEKNDINQALRNRIDELKEEIQFLRKTYVTDEKEETLIDKKIQESVKPPEE